MLWFFFSLLASVSCSTAWAQYPYAYYSQFQSSQTSFNNPFQSNGYNYFGVSNYNYSSPTRYNLLGLSRTDQINLNLNQLRFGRPFITGRATYINGMVSSGTLTIQGPASATALLNIIDTSSTTIFRVQGDQHIGMGIANPTNFLDLKRLVDTGDDGARGLEENFTVGGTPSTLYGSRIDLTINNARSLGTFYGYYVAAPVVNGTLNNKYVLISEANAGAVGLGVTSPVDALDVNGGIKLSSVTTYGGIANTLLSSAGQGKIWFDSTKNKFLKSENGGNATPMVDPVVVSSRTYLDVPNTTTVTLFSTSSTSGILNTVMVRPNGGAATVTVYIDNFVMMSATATTTNNLVVNPGGYFSDAGTLQSFTSDSTVLVATSPASVIHLGWGFKNSMTVVVKNGSSNGGFQATGIYSSYR